DRDAPSAPAGSRDRIAAPTSPALPGVQQRRRLDGLSLAASRRQRIGPRRAETPKDEAAARGAERLQEGTEGLAAAATTAGMAGVIVDQGMPILDARTGIFGVLDDPDQLHFVRSTGYGDVFPERLSLNEPRPITWAVRRQKLIELRDVDQRRAAYVVPERIWEASGKGTLVATPLLGRSGPVGALGFTRESPRPLTPRERRLVETLARQAALALERAGLFEAEREQRQQAEGLQRVASAVATAATVEEVAAAVAREASTVLGVDGVTVLLTSARSEDTAEVLASCGTVEPYARSEPTVDLDAGTLTASAIRLDRPLFAESLAQLEASWPDSAAVAQAVGIETVACVPIHVGARRGAISI